LDDAKRLRQTGQAESISEFTGEEFPISDTVHGHVLALVARGLCGADAYYRGSYDGGAVFFTLREVPLAKYLDTSPMTMIRVLQDVISQVPVRHLPVAQAFFRQQGYTLAEEAGQITATHPDGDGVTVQFDAQGRIANMKATLSPESVTNAKKRPWWRLGG
jgi:hypothetical protein